MGGRFPDNGGGGTRRTLIEHASGGAWTPVASPNDGTPTTDNTLMAVGGTAATGLWAVGYRQSPTGLKPLVLRYDTTLPSPSWVSVSGAGGVPSPGTVETVLTGVEVRTASDVWAVGYYDDGSGKRPLALHWDGSTWSNSPIPGVGMLRKVRAVAPGNVWAVGAYYNAIVHAPRRSWCISMGPHGRRCSSADSGTRTDELIGLAADPSGSMITMVGRRAEPARRTGDLPHGAGVAPHPGGCAGSSRASRAGCRPGRAHRQAPPRRGPRSR